MSVSKERRHHENHEQRDESKLPPLPQGDINRSIDYTDSKKIFVKI